MKTTKLRNNKSGTIITFYLNDFGYLFHNAFASSKLKWSQCFINGDSISANDKCFEKVARNFYKKCLKSQLEAK